VTKVKENLRNSRARLRIHPAKITLARNIGSAATSPEIPHGVQANQFGYYAKWGVTPVQAPQTSFINAARISRILGITQWLLAGYLREVVAESEESE
jgi:hypothetical protein